MYWGRTHHKTSIFWPIYYNVLQTLKGIERVIRFAFHSSLILLPRTNLHVLLCQLITKFLFFWWQIKWAKQQIAQRIQLSSSSHQPEQNLSLSDPLWRYTWNLVSWYKQHSLAALLCSLIYSSLILLCFELIWTVMTYLRRPCRVNRIHITSLCLVRSYESAQTFIHLVFWSTLPTPSHIKYRSLSMCSKTSWPEPYKGLVFLVSHMGLTHRHVITIGYYMPMVAYGLTSWTRLASHVTVIA